jgi:hypothetical protein
MIFFIMALQPDLGLGHFSRFLILYTVGKTPWTGDQSVTRPLPTHRTIQTQNKLTQTSMSWLGFEPTTPVFERAKTVHASGRSATMIGMIGWLLTIKLEKIVDGCSSDLIWGRIPRWVWWNWGRLWTACRDSRVPSGDFNLEPPQYEGGILITRPERSAKFHQNLLNSIFVKWVMNWQGDMWLLGTRIFYTPVAMNVLKCENFTARRDTVAV